MLPDKKIITEDKEQFYGCSFGADKDVVLELVFNTSPVGYQEIISDPSYTDQAVVMAYPLIGNYGINKDDFESDKLLIGALIVKEYVDDPSNFRSDRSLSECMKEHDIAGVTGIDTRSLIRKIREFGSCKVLITSKDISSDEGVAILKEWDYSHDQVKRAGGNEKEIFLPASGKVDFHIALIDCGAKANIIRSLNALDIKVTAVPSTTPASDILSLGVDGVLISNGPGDPVDNVQTIETVRALHGKLPIMGICLGHQILALSYGAKTYKLKFGHRGGNHPVKNLITDKVEITSQNHSYAVDKESAEKAGLEITH